ncbi:MAG: hypothetical protein PHV85_05505 [Desulfovibrionaceae bacterium]|nr:hypothetical protein [Desulfovibrionaceae bacterium]
MSLELPWQRYALIAELARRLDGVSPQFGKTALQKLVYFLQTIYGVDCGYSYEFYSYGPFTSQLLNDLDLVAHFGGVSVEPGNSMMGGYHIKPKDVDSIIERATEFLSEQQNRKALDSLVETYGRMTAKNLELRATIVYIERDMQRKKIGAKRGEICRLVSEIKPKFSTWEIEQAVDELNKRKHIQLSA